jgi:hypothetical protein
LQQNKIAELIGISPQHKTDNRLSFLEVINLSGNQITNISALQNCCMKIKTLRLSNNKNLDLDSDSAAIETLKKTRKSLEVLMIDEVIHHKDITAHMEKFDKLARLGIDQINAVRSHKTMKRLVISGKNSQLMNFDNVNYANFPKLDELEIQQPTTKDCNILVNLAQHLQQQGIKFMYNDQLIHGTNFDIWHQLDCHSLILESAIWIGVTILSLICLILAIVSCRYRLEKNRQQKLIKRQAKTELKRYKSVQYPTEVNPII